MATRLKLALLSMAGASALGWYGCTGGSDIVNRTDAGSSSGGGTVAGTGGGAVAGAGGSASGGSTATGSGGDTAGSGGSTGPGTGGSRLGSGGVTGAGTGGQPVAGSGSTTGSGGGAGTGGGVGAGGTGAGGTAAGGGGSTVARPINVLIWNNALTYGHAARVGAIQYLKARESTDNLTFDTAYAHTQNVTEGPVDTSFDASVFTDAGLDKYDVVLFLDTTGATIDDSQMNVRRQALRDFIEKKGRGFVGTHSATDTYQGTLWPWYVDFIGANFKDHSVAGTSGTAQYYQMMTHPILMAAATPSPWNRSEEWYVFTRDPSSSAIPGIKILLTCHDVVMTGERPSAWIHEMPVPTGGARGGRMFYTAFGHYTSAFQEKPVLDLIVAGIKWAAYRL